MPPSDMSLNPVLILLLLRTPARETGGEGGGGSDGEGAKLRFRSAGQSRETRDSEFCPDGLISLPSPLSVCAVIA